MDTDSTSVVVSRIYEDEGSGVLKDRSKFSFEQMGASPTNTV